MIYEMIVIAGVILIFIAIVGGKKIEIKEVKIGDLTNTQRSIIGVVGIIVVVLGFWQPTVPTFTPTITVKITSPQEDAIIPYNNITVNGIASNVPNNSSLRVFVRHEMDNNIYPSGGRIPISQDKKWHVVTWLDKPGMKYEICAALADERADEEFQNYTNTCEEKGYPGMLFPKGTTVYSTVNVTQELYEHK